MDLEGQFEIELAGRIDIGEKRRPADNLRNRSRRSGQLIRARPRRAARKGLLQNSESLCGKVKKATTHAGRPERRSVQHEDEAAVLLWLQSEAQASPPPKGGALTDAGDEERARDHAEHRDDSA